MNFDPTADAAKCPFLNGELNHGAGSGTRNSDWWRVTGHMPRAFTVTEE